jgi:hypothetical protein
MEPYKSAHHPILHRCLIHGEEYLCTPSNAKKGQGLQCCRREHARSNTYGAIPNTHRHAAAAATYAKRLAAIGKLIALESYPSNAHTPILHKCLVHGEVHLQRPANAVRGYGLKCCQFTGIKINARRSKSEASAAYDAKLAAVGRLVRLEKYKGKAVPILHRCLEHGEKHFCTPNNAYSGQGLICCRAAAAMVNTLASVIFGSDPFKMLNPCSFYIYGVKDRPDLVKPGISSNHERRAKKGCGLYGSIQAAWDLPSRRNALLIEGAILRDPSIIAPVELGELGELDGATEIRSIAPDTLAFHAQSLIDSLADHFGPWQQWALDNVPTLHPAEQIALRRQMT